MDVELVRKFNATNIFIDEKGCRNWLGWIGSSGYAQLYYKKKIYTVSRLAYQLHYKKKPGKKMVCHTCDNKICVNPGHLFLGTHKDNMRDMVEKSRAHRVYTPKKLTETKVKKINKYLAFGMTNIMIAKEFGISDNHVSNIKHGRRWPHVTPYTLDTNKTKETDPQTQLPHQ